MIIETEVKKNTTIELNAEERNALVTAATVIENILDEAESNCFDDYEVDDEIIRIFDNYLGNTFLCSPQSHILDYIEEMPDFLKALAKVKNK